MFSLIIISVQSKITAALGKFTAVKPRLVGGVNAAIPWLTVVFGYRRRSYHEKVDLP